MKFIKFDPSSLALIGIVDKEGFDTIQVDDETANKFLARPKLMLMFRVKNGILIETGILDVSHTITPVSTELYSWPEWDKEEIPTKDQCNAIVTVINKPLDKPFEDYALFHVFEEMKIPAFLTDKDDVLNILEVIPEIKNLKTSTTDIIALKHQRLAVWSSISYKNCYIVDNKTFELVQAAL